MFSAWTNQANIRLGEDVLKMSWRRIEDVFSVTFFCLPRRLKDIIGRRLANTSWRCLEDVLEDVLKTSWRRFRKTFCKYVLKTSSRRLGRRKVLRWRRLQDVLKTSWKTRNVCWEGFCKYCFLFSVINSVQVPYIVHLKTFQVKNSLHKWEAKN